MTPAARQALRIANGTEMVYPEMGNGILFQLKGGAPGSGTVAYGPFRFVHSIDEAVTDNGVLTQDLHLADSLRGLDIYTETQQ